MLPRAHDKMMHIWKLATLTCDSLQACKLLAEIFNTSKITKKKLKFFSRQKFRNKMRQACFIASFTMRNKFKLKIVFFIILCKRITNVTAIDLMRHWQITSCLIKKHQWLLCATKLYIYDIDETSRRHAKDAHLKTCYPIRNKLVS